MRYSMIGPLLACGLGIGQPSNSSGGGDGSLSSLSAGAPPHRVAALLVSVCRKCSSFRDVPGMLSSLQQRGALCLLASKAEQLAAPQSQEQQAGQGLGQHGQHGQQPDDEEPQRVSPPQQQQQGHQQLQQQGARELRRVPSFNLCGPHGRAAEVDAAMASGCWAETVSETCIRASDLPVPGDQLARIPF